MDPIRRRELKRQAFMRLAAQRRRAARLRGRVVVLSLLCFAVLWAIVFAQMATGNDPALSSKEKAVSAGVGSSSASSSSASSSRQEAEKATRREAKPPAETEPPVEAEAEEEPLVTSQS